LVRLCYSIYKVQFVRPRIVSSVNFYILAQNLSLVKNFFRFFSNFFRPFLRTVVRSNFYMLTHRSSFVKNFFSFPVNFFVPPSSRMPRSSDSLRILSPLPPFVKTFFQYFSFFFSTKTRHPKRVRMPGIVSHSYRSNLIPYLQSIHIRRHCAYTPRQIHHRYPHRGKQRRHDSADSSVAQPLRGA